MKEWKGFMSDLKTFDIIEIIKKILRTAFEVL